MQIRGGLAVLAFMLVSAAGCAAKPKPPVEPGPAETAGEPATGDPVATVRPTPTPEAMCKRMRELTDEGCADNKLSYEECVAEFRRSFEARGDAAREAITMVGHCLLDNGTCEAVSTCVSNLSATGAGTRACTDDPNDKQFMGKPVGLSPDEYARRKGADVTLFSKHDSSKEAPIEACGVDGKNVWLVHAKCNDGSNPFPSKDHAHAARVGNVGPGGRCGAFVDVYEVPCPEGTYEVFLDGYVCPAPVAPTPAPAPEAP